MNQTRLEKTTEEEIRKKVKEILKYIQRSWFVHKNNIKIDGEEYNDTILFSLLTALIDGKELIVGNYGLGKTTLAEAILSIVHGVPVEVYQAAKLNGHSEQTEEKIIGRPDLGAFQQGKEKVIWSLFAQAKGKILDEINRLPPGKQTELLDAIDRGIFKYLNEVLFQPEQPFFATANYPDRGNTPLIEPLVDRFDIVTEATLSPYAVAIANGFVEEEKNKISDPVLAEEIIKIFLDTNKPYKQKLQEIYERKSEEFIKKLSEKGITFLLGKDEKEEIKKEIKELKLSEDTELFLNYFRLSLYNPYTGENRPGELTPEENHYQAYLPGKITNSLSQRFFNSVVKYAKALAWFRGHEKIEVEDVIIVMPYALAHRAKFDEKYLEEVRQKRNDINEYNKSFLNLYVAKELVKEMYKEFEEDKEEIKEAFLLAREGKKEELEKLAKEKDHPFYKGLYWTLIITEKYGH